MWRASSTIWVERKIEQDIIDLDVPELFETRPRDVVELRVERLGSCLQFHRAPLSLKLEGTSRWVQFECEARFVGASGLDGAVRASG